MQLKYRKKFFPIKINRGMLHVEPIFMFLDIPLVNIYPNSRPLMKANKNLCVFYYFLCYMNPLVNVIVTVTNIRIIVNITTRAPFLLYPLKTSEQIG